MSFVSVWCLESWELWKKKQLSASISHVNKEEGGVKVAKYKYKQVPISHVDEWEDGVEGGHHHVSEGEVQQEVICYTPHTAMGWKYNNTK